MSVPEHVTLAREAWQVGLIVTHLMPAPFSDQLAVQMWQPDGTLWIEGRFLSAASIRAHIDHWPAHRAALAGLRLVTPTRGQALDCGCVTTPDTTKERT